MVFESDIMNLNFKDALGYLTFKNLEKYSFLKHAYSTRIGGVSKNYYKSLNLGFENNDDLKCVEENYNIFCNVFDIDKSLLASTYQIHEDKIKKVEKKDLKGFTKFKDTDALITNVKGITLATLHADCLPVYMIDVKNQVIGLAHAGWKGTYKNIAGKLAKEFVKSYNSNLNNIVCAIGPGIGECCFEVGNEVLEIFKSLDIPKDYILGNKINLLKVNKNFLIKSGVKAQNIILSDVCTMCNKDILFSHRASNGKRGNNAAFISIL